MRKLLLVFLVSLLSASFTGCNMGLAYGDPNAIIVVSAEEGWPEMQDSVFAVLGPDVYTLRTERTFRLTHQAPVGENWLRLRKFKEVVMIGGPDDFWIAEPLATLDDPGTHPVPGIAQAEDVWAKNQHITMMLVDPNGDVSAQVYGMAGEVHSIIDERFRRGALQRMFVSGTKETLADSLRMTAGFSLTLPEVYQWVATDSLYIFRNDNPDPAELIRQFGVTWRSPIPDNLTVDSLMDWREAVADKDYDYPQVVDRTDLPQRTLALGDMTVTEVRGAWENPPGSWPAAGPFIFWTVACPEQNRLYYLDAWLYAPGKDKWEYILQLETVMGSFRCGFRAAS
ncbi:MAG: DUF4837 family protein [Gemmatimonadetes bacterium]|nr:DUF4837 family protein [Gemmatimonadota bacterium]